jgi:hypothetical protein
MRSDEMSRRTSEPEVLVMWCLVIGIAIMGLAVAFATIY